MTKMLFETSGPIATITINNPEKLNCLDLSMLLQLEDILNNIGSDGQLRVIVLQGAGNKAFSTGGNLKDFGSLATFREVERWITTGQQVFNQLESMPMATIAAITGYAMGGGLELALACDLRIASDHSIFAMPELKLGWVPGWGALCRLPRLIGEARAKELIMTANRINTEKALEFSLINRAVPLGELKGMVNELANELAEIDPVVFKMSKMALLDGRQASGQSDMIYDVLGTYYSMLRTKGYDDDTDGKN
jgi:enoyl-CoA hydratase